MLSLVHVLISSMLQFDKSIHPVVLYKYYFVCIFMKIHENFKKKMRENHVNTISLGEGLSYDLSCAPRAF